MIFCIYETNCSTKPYFCYRNAQYENFHIDQKGYDQMYDGEDLETPPSPDRPPPRPIGNIIQYPVAKNF